MKQFLLAAAAGALTALATPVLKADIVHFGALLGPEAVGATGGGSVTVAWDTVDNTLLIDATWSGLSGVTTVAHIHCCTAVAGTGTVGVAVTPGTLPGFPVGVSSGSYTSPLIDLDNPANFTAGFITSFAGGVAANADDALIAGIDAGRAYFNIHTNTFPGGEIRGFLQLQQAVSEPTSIALVALALFGMIGVRSRRKS